MFANDDVKPGQTLIAARTVLRAHHVGTELVPVRLVKGASGLSAVPVRGKSGLISQLSMADGYVKVERNQEGLSAETEVMVTLL